MKCCKYKESIRTQWYSTIGTSCCVKHQHSIR